MNKTFESSKMSESVAEPGSFTQDLFSPLQFCEVVEEGQHQQRPQQLLQQQQHQQILHPNHVSSQHISNAIHSPQQQHNIQQSQLQNHAQSIQIKQENSQHTSLQQSHQINEQSNKQEIISNPISSMEILLSSNPVQLDAVNSMVGFQQHQIPQQLYQVQLNQHQQLQHLQLNTMQLTSSLTNVQQSPQLNQLPHNLPQQRNTNVVTAVPVSLPVVTLLQSKVPSTNAVATQTTPLDQTMKENDDEPEIIFTSTGLLTTGTPTILTTTSNRTINGICVDSKSQCTNNEEKKPVPVKKTWRRPWKKKKEREKRQPAKKTRRVKRRRMVPPKKSIIQIDPRHGPPIDTACTVVQRESEDTINQLKQKRQRIKLNRNSGREYVNRLGKVVRARKIGQPCNCPLKCWDRMGSKILEIFNNFWDLCDFNLQNSYLFTCLKLCDVKRRYTKKVGKPAEESRRQNTFEYFVRISGKHLRVCKKAFMSSHGLTSDKRLRTLFTQMKDGALIPEPDKRGKHLRPSKSQLNQSSNNNSHVSQYLPPNQNKSKSRIRVVKKRSPPTRIETAKQTMYSPPNHPMGHHLHPHCTPPPSAHGTSMQEPPHAYIPNGDIYFTGGHYLEPPQPMGSHHMNQIPCQKMLEAPAYFMAGMKENTFHQ